MALLYGPIAVDEIRKALGLPDEMAVRSVVLRADDRCVVTVDVEFVPTEAQLGSVGEWLRANRDRVLLDAKFVPAPPAPETEDFRG